MNLELVVFIGMCAVIGVFAFKLRRSASERRGTGRLKESGSTALYLIDKGGPFAIDEHGWENPEEDKEKDQRRELEIMKVITAVIIFVKLIAVYLLSIVSYLILGQFVLFGIIEGGLHPIGFILFFITRAGFADLVSSLFLGIQESNSSDFGRDLVLAMLIFGVPILSLTEILRLLFGIWIKLPLPYVSLMQFTILGALIYEFPRLVLFIVIKRSLVWYKIQRRVVKYVIEGH